MYTRNLYLAQIGPFLGKPVVKVITGMRRSGKSCLVRLLIDKLVAPGVITAGFSGGQAGFCWRGWRSGSIFKTLEL